MPVEQQQLVLLLLVNLGVHLVSSKRTQQQVG
jgi:hypothetical protein